MDALADGGPGPEPGEHGRASCAPRPAYPFALRLTVEYRLGRDGLTVVTDADNIGTTDLPFGLGFHPYLTVGTPTVDQVRLQVPGRADGWSPTTGACPTGRVPVAGTEFDFTQGRLIGVTRLDTGFTGLQRDPDGRARVELDHPDGGAGVTPVGRRAVRLPHGLHRGHPRPRGQRRTAVAVEPMSCPPDAFRSGTDLVVLHPGGRWTGSWGITPR